MIHLSADRGHTQFAQGPARERALYVLDQAATTQLASLAAAVLAGLIIGTERGWVQRERPAGARVAGIRTFGILGLIGGLAGLLPNAVMAVLLGGGALLIAAGYRAAARSDQLSATSAVAGLLTLAIGCVATRLSVEIALGVAAATFALLRSRQTLHAVLRGLEEREIEAVARFLLVSLVVLPLLPDADFGPYGAWNPRRIWMVVVMVTGLSFAGYVLARRMGQGRGIMIVAMTGALVSSTAVTASYARRLRTEPEARGALVAGIAMASVVMFVRVLVVTLALAPRALPSLALSLAPGVVVAGALAALAWRRQETPGESGVVLGNPFDFGPALLLAALVAVLSLVARWALDEFGGQGMAMLLSLTGMMDVDAAVLTLAGLPRNVLGDELAGIVLAGPVLANTAIKAFMALGLGGGRDGLRAAAPLFLAALASAAGIAVQWLA